MIVLVVVMGLTSENDTGDRLTCSIGILLFCVGLFHERKRLAILFGFLASVWAVVLQPGILNRCHLTLWILIFEAFRNLVVVENHVTLSWGHATAGRILGLCQ